MGKKSSVGKNESLQESGEQESFESETSDEQQSTISDLNVSQNLLEITQSLTENDIS
jgi:hypothetical protein